MKVLIILLGTFGIGLVVTKLSGDFSIKLSAQIAMAVMMAFTALGHFKFTRGMAMMLPSFIPYKKQVVYITGVIEIAAAAGLLIPATRTLTAWCLILFFIVLTPANINAAMKHINMEKGTFDGPGPAYLWFRIPLQLLFMAWVSWSCLL
ncbi:DoxX family protein [Mucilaginibacter sp. RCC_168]|uniref:DoxX family protein n=1 Tax=Mucilaginibacter sp. RCC_168 TaxID=3239221 RepID=UPI0035264356